MPGALWRCIPACCTLLPWLESSKPIVHKAPLNRHPIFVVRFWRSNFSHAILSNLARRAERESDSPHSLYRFFKRQFPTFESNYFLLNLPHSDARRFSESTLISDLSSFSYTLSFRINLGAIFRLCIS